MWLRSTAVHAASHAVRAVLGLPDPLLRLLGGQPVDIDGQRLGVSAQVLLRLQRFNPFMPPHRSNDLAGVRTELDRVAAMFGARDSGRVSSRDEVIPGAAGLLRIRCYEPAGLSGPGPLLVFYHGGGFVLGSIDSHDRLCRFLAEEADVRVVSVAYRLAPEHPFPAAVDDALAAFRYLVEHAERFGAEPRCVAVGGDSAGGNLAAVVAHETVACGGPAPVFSLLLYPSTEVAVPHRSHDLFGKGFLLDNDMLVWFRDLYLPEQRDHIDPRVSVLRQTNLTGLPPTFVATAGFDPLRDEGDAYAQRLRDAGVQVLHRRFPALRHGFANTMGIDNEARAAMHQVASALRTGLAFGASPRERIRALG
jgi:acetyl esterase